MEHFQGADWSSFEGHILADDDRQALAKKHVQALVDAWTASLTQLPSVCQPGIDCREEKFEQLLEMLTHMWGDALKSINTEIESGVSFSDRTAEAAFREAYDCKDGCYCERIDVVYDDILETQTTINNKLTELSARLTAQLDEEDYILKFCPDYRDDVAEYSVFNL